MDTLGLDRTYVVHAGEQSFPLAEDVQAVAAADIVDWRW